MATLKSPLSRKGTIFEDTLDMVVHDERDKLDFEMIFSLANLKR
jgi:hypothetical protein